MDGYQCLRIRSCIAPVVAVLFVAGCAALDQAVEPYGSVRVDLARFEAPPPQKANVFLIRPANIHGAPRDLFVSANNVKIATLLNLSYVSFLAGPGPLTIAGEGGAFSFPTRTRTVAVSGGESIYLVYRQTALIGNRADFDWAAVSREEAQRHLDSINQVVPTMREIPGR